MRLRVGWLILCLALAACDGVVGLHSQRPLFSFQDPTAVLKEGVWITDEGGCDIDGSRPVAEWPECARVAVVGGGFIGDWPIRYPYVITPNAVRVMQIGYAEDEYGYETVTALEYDAEGRVTALRRESLACTAEQVTEDSEAPVEPAPVAQGPNLPCPVTDAGAVLDLAEASAAFTGVEPNFRWVRDTLE